MMVTLQYFDECPNWRATHALLLRLSGEYGFSLELTEVDSIAEADRLGFRGSPSVLIDGADPFASPSAPVGLSCRVYRGPNGLIGGPSEEMLRSALTAAVQ
ncbi:MAG: thioredoxin family protein [Actinobacteria bacterium]|nr:thioredoxin family protein [Actinomycetota bacterium]MBU1493014.1 thioredoxin family protein [Actinomycetota bacterium]